MQRVILYLTIALVGVGLMVLVTEYVVPPEEKFFTDVASYNKELKDLIDSGDIPPLPPCAQSIEVTRTEKRIDAIDFICSSEADRNSFRDLIFADYAWEVKQGDEIGESDRVRVDRLIPNP